MIGSDEKKNETVSSPAQKCNARTAVFVMSYYLQYG